MQDNFMSRWLSPLMAFCLSFILIVTLAPVVGVQAERQIDFWLLWLGTMLVLALPICYLEIALAKRSKATALQALSSLTRDADTSPKWRLAGWLAVTFIPFLAGAVLSNSGQLLLNQQAYGLNSTTLFTGLVIVALALSFIGRQLLILLSLLAVLVSLILANVLGASGLNWQMTAIEFSEWGSATALALVASGLGLGVYWQNSLAQVQQRDAASRTVLPIWVAQVLAVLAFAFFSVNSQISAFTLLVAALAASALMLQMAREQLVQRQLAPIVQWVLLLVPLLLWLIPDVSVILDHVLLLWGLLISLIYAVFVGWMMKISHLRKSMNFSHELFYNLWRIAVRVVLPLAIVFAIVALVRTFL